MSGVVIEISALEAAHLADIVAQFVELLTDTDPSDVGGDPAIARLVPDAYRDDADAAAEFRRFTQSDLLERRRAEGAEVARTLRDAGAAERVSDLEDRDATAMQVISLDDAQVDAWLRTITAIRLILAVRLGIHDDTDDLSHPRFGIYTWLGYRLEGLLDAMEG